MLRSLAPRCDRFVRDEGGAVAVIFGITLVGIVGAVSAAIDYSQLVGARAQLQAAADAAVLAAMPGYSGGQASSTARKAAEAALNAAMPGSQPTLSLRPAANGQLCAVVSLKVRMIMPVGFSNGKVGATSCAANNATYEIALALDNTGSMAEAAGGQSKIQALVSAATGLVNVINPNAAAPNAAISVVPFASAVNVGADYFYKSGANWLDRYGQSSIHWQNYARPLGAAWTPASRFDLFAAMGATWGGCVEERPQPYLTTDDAPSSAKPDTLFVPFLAPDDAGAPAGATCYAFTPSGQYPATPAGGCGGKYLSYNSYLNDDGGACAAGDAYATADSNDPVSHGSGASKVCKYKGQSVASVNSAISGVNGGPGLFPAGPNLGCSVAALTPLTNDMSAISGSGGALSKMVPNGDTALLPGFMWAWRTISPNGPFASAGGGSIGPKSPKAYGQANNTKILVLMTDGFDHWVGNASSPYQSMYSSLGFYVNNRVSAYGGGSAGPTTSTNYRAQMDAALLEACTNAKQAGVQIYTVGFSVPSNPIDATGINVLQSCASAPTNAYIAQDANAIVATFQTIANNILTRRLTR